MSGSRLRQLVLLFLLVVIAFLLALSVGSISIDWSGVVEGLQGLPGSVDYTVVMQLRLPRAINAFVVGAMLALAGALMQVLLRNPLADPYVLGVSGGAAVAALFAILLGWQQGWISLAAAVGALLSMALVFSLSRGRGDWSTTRLLLTGVVLAAGWGAVVSFILAISPDAHVRGMLFWLMGDINESFPGWLRIGVLVAALVAACGFARSLNLLSLGELRAESLGVNTGALRIGLFFLAGLLTASAVTIAGAIGFIGLVVPHIVRLWGGSDHRLVLPASVLLGGTLLVVAETLARTVMAPSQLPVGVITAFIGVPVFLYLLRSGSSVGRS
ncbi:MAG: iron ABC transporter permease [Arenicellales bacterium]|jgi:iron complex transport system permease protein|nr:ABC transporter permease [Acidiferrobacteraceae bacterium]MDP6137421.1 iron ABC transporter permease [Arenicellales bacterium]HCF72528.1 ABC transporter permease [Gammaproteobacteria bacterium]MDP6392251.1 iron ABC transporter permease [Arenicellales bacterium]MDP7220812.1 iron ABC transporter permease [Arenicellales bacterium]|tara:strand:- start:9428 stop:10414 length:987 start_codon:yes stop_codon:yes gene_type:complete